MTTNNSTAHPPTPRFDAVAMQRAIRDRMSQETADMSIEELQQYLRDHIAVSFSPRTAERPIAA